MSWTIYKKNVLTYMEGAKTSNNGDGLADYIANEYDACIKRGGDMIYGVPVLNGNITGMAQVIKDAFKKGQEAVGENFNIQQEIFPAAFEAYWNGAEMAPFPNPILRPLGWQSTPPAPGTYFNIGPNPAYLAASAAKNKALEEFYNRLIEEIKQISITIDGVGEIYVYDTAKAIYEKKETISEDGKKISKEIKDNPQIKAGVALFKKLKEAKKKKPATGSQTKPSVKIPFPKLPSRKKIIEEETQKLLDKQIKKIEEELQKLAIQNIIEQYVKSIKQSLTQLQIPLSDAEIRRYVEDSINGFESQLLALIPQLPKLPTKEEFQQFIDNLVPSKQEIETRARQEIVKLIPNIPFFNFTPPSYTITPNNPFVNPFVNYAKLHLTGVGGTMVIISAYPPVSQPAPAVITWSGYTIIG